MSVLHGYGPCPDSPKFDDVPFLQLKCLASSDLTDEQQHARDSMWEMRERDECSRSLDRGMGS